PYGCLVEPAIATTRPQRPLRRDIDRIRILRMDRNTTNVFRVLEAQIFPTLAAIFRFVHAVAIADTALRVALAGAHPNDGRIFRIELHIANRVRALMFKYRRPCRAVVLSLPHSSGGCSHVVLPAILW